MTDEQKGSPKEQGNTFNFTCCQGWSKMKLDQAKGYDCAGMISRMMKMCDVDAADTAAPEEPASPDTIV